MKRVTAQPNYHFGPFPKRKAPLDWNETGKITAWQESDTMPVACTEKRWAWTWNETLGTIGLWALTLPPKSIEYVRRRDYKAPKGKDESEDGRSVYAPAGYETKLHENLWRFSLAPLKDAPSEAVRLMQIVDELARTDAWLEDNPDHFGVRRYMNFLPRSPEWLAKHAADRAKVIETLGELLFGAIRERDGDGLSDLGKVIEAGRDVPLMTMEMGDLPLRFAGNDLRGVVWRCYHILDLYLRNQPLCEPGFVAGVPVKRTLRNYALQEWEAMAGKEVTVQTEFSRILKELGLSALPDASSAPGGQR